MPVSLTRCSAQYRAFQTLYRLGVFISRSTRGLYAIDRVWIPATLEVRSLIYRRRSFPI
jgi:hypothetical protein